MPATLTLIICQSFCRGGRWEGRGGEVGWGGVGKEKGEGGIGAEERGGRVHSIQRRRDGEGQGGEVGTQGRERVWTGSR